MVVVAWLDATPEDQRRIHEIVGMFTVKDSVDEIGARRIVIGLADELFPGTSVQHTRARYLLIIPWLCMRALNSKDPRRRLDALQRRMIDEFLADDELPESDRVAGLFGRATGRTVKQLPSAAYWEALVKWGILSDRHRPEDVFDHMRSERQARGRSEAHELAERLPTVWHHGVGKPPPGFPETNISTGLRMQRHEAEWLQERWRATAPGSLLSSLANSTTPLGEAWAPWVEPLCLSDDANRELLADAQRFSLAAEGAQCLYACLVAERYRAHGFTSIVADAEQYDSELLTWQESSAAAANLFDGWSPEPFWQRLVDKGTAVDVATRFFFDRWFEVTALGGTVDIIDDAVLRKLVTERELTLKRGQSRLHNERHLQVWRGTPASPITYRWQQVQRLVKDVHEGLGI